MKQQNNEECNQYTAWSQKCAPEETADENFVSLSTDELKDIIQSAVQEALAQHRTKTDIVPHEKGENILSVEQIGTWLLNTWQFIQNRRTGSYTVDEFGFDQDFYQRFVPLFHFLYRYYWRIDTIGIHHVPAQGRALLVANHSGTLPYDAMMIAMAIQHLHPHPRIVRFLFLKLFSAVPFANVFLSKIGFVVANPDNALELLKRNELTGVFPEGVKGIGKYYSQRYQLARFGRGGFIRVALQTGSPIIPVAVIGAEEIHPLMAKSDLLARIFKIPYFPITPTFPLLGPLGLLPLPSKWSIIFGKAIPCDNYPPEAVHDERIIMKLSDLVRNEIQKLLLENLRKRNSSFFA